MQTHLLKRCPGLTQEDRAHIFNEMQRSPGKASEKRARNDATGGRQSHDSGGNDVQQTVERAMTGMSHQQQLEQQHQVDSAFGRSSQTIPQQLPPSTHSVPCTYEPTSFMLQGHGSALHTLAEVSRRHLDFSAQRSMSFGVSQEATFMRQSERALLEQTLMAAMQQQPHSIQAVSHNREEDSLFVQDEYDQQLLASTHQMRSIGHVASLPLVQAASAANHQLEQTEAISEMHRASVPQLDGSHDDMDHITSQSDAGMVNADLAMWSSAPQQPLTQHQSPPSTHPLPGFDALPALNRNTNRARFTEDRRKEVEEIRKRGACIRCRMLKKPCSEGTPCERCQKVKVARLWNLGCLRTRLAGELNLFSTSYFHVEMGRHFANVQEIPWERMSGKLEVKFFSRSAPALTLGFKQHSPAQSVSARRIGGNGDLFQLDEGMSLVGKVAEYCSNDSTTQAAIASEGSAFLKTTLHTARALLGAELSQEGLQVKKPHPNYIEPRVLLKQVLELWVESLILARSSSIDNIMLRLNHHASSESSTLQNVNCWDNDTMLPITGASHRLIKTQLLAALENRVHRLSKSILNELEHRLLQRQQVSAFATFIAAVIFLNCVERMSAFYRMFDNESALHSWPLQAPPPAIWTQSTNFAHLLTMLLRLRALPPKTTRTERGTLAVLQDHGLPVQRNGVPVRDHHDEGTQQAALWLDPMDLEVDWLIARRDETSIAGPGGEEAWKRNDLRFISMVLLGENM